MKRSLCSMGIATLLALSSIPAKAADDNLVYVAVEPCRIADTRKSTLGVMFNSVPRNFLVSGSTGELSAQGGNAAGCVHPRAGTGVEPLAASVYMVAVPTASSVGGWLTAFPSDQPTPTSNSVATVNYAKGQVIGNTTNVTLCQPDSCPTSGQLGLVSFSSQQQVVLDVQGYFYPAASSCSDDMVSVGSVCVDKYEASLVDSSGTPLTDATTCDVSGSDCGAGLSGAIFAQSEAGVTPINNISWYQAAQACANVGKRLPTTAEWQMAASGTVVGTGIAPDCNAPPGGGAIALTGASANCISNTGAYDMVGNLMEFSANLDASQVSAGSSASTDDLLTVALGCSYVNNVCNNAPSTSSMFVLLNGPDTPNSQIGFRCVR